MSAPELVELAAGPVILLLAPAFVHGSPTYAAALEEVRRRHPGAKVVPDAGLWNGLADWKANHKATLRGLAPTDLYVVTAPDRTVGRGIFNMWLILAAGGVRCRAALFPATPGESFEVIEGFELRVTNAEDWRRYAVPVANGSPKARTGDGASRG